MRAGSLCAGIGGADLALEALGVEVAWHAEIDPDASAVLAHHWPDVPNVGDIKAADWSTVEPVDVLVAGYPCQPFSTAGQRKGSDDPRHLWPAVRRAVAELRPRYVLLENVRGHLTLGFAEVLADLAALGFDAEWGVLGSADVGGCHRRQRLWVAAADPGRFPLWSEPFGIAGSGGAVVARLDRQAAGGLNLLPTPTTADGKGGPGNQGRAGGENLRTAVTLLPTPQASDGDGGRKSTNLEWVEGTAYRPSGAKASIPLGTAIEQFGRYQAAVDRWAALFGPPPEPTEPNTRGGRRLHAPFPEWMMGYPAGWVTDHVGRAAALRCIGNAIQPQTAVVAWGELLARLDQRAPSTPTHRPKEMP